jgi:transcriptional regulator with XRE-family HTH domain
MLEKGFRADASKVRKLREERGLTQEELARKAGCVKRTVENVEAGRPILPRILMEIEDALGVKRWSLRQSSTPTVLDVDVPETFLDEALPQGSDDTDSKDNIVVAEGAAMIELVINEDFDSYSDQQQQHLVQAMKELLATDKPFRVIRKRRGSVILTLEMTPEQAERLYWAVKAGRLSHLNVADANLTGKRLDDLRDDGLDADLDERRDDADRRTREIELPAFTDRGQTPIFPTRPIPLRSWERVPHTAQQ